MVSAHGYANCIAWVDLTNKKIEYREVDEEDARKFIGGRGLGGRIILKNEVGKDPLAPKKVIAVLNGLLTGTTVPMSGRIVAVARSPLTGVFADTHAGGWAGAAMKWAEFDAVVMHGASDQPVYLLVKNETVSIEPADGLWGKTPEEAYHLLVQKYGKAVQFYGIGPAGENLVKFANLMHFGEGALGRASGRTGLGAVFGSKKVKALVIIGDEKTCPSPPTPKNTKESVR
ncbi:MAG: aldehyde ferredoxin oxidoreductase N-terminal domain-containing protein [Candidatus Caldarchaeum sp.]